MKALKIGMMMLLVAGLTPLTASAAWREGCATYKEGAGKVTYCMDVNDSTNQTRVRLYNKTNYSISRKFVVYRQGGGKIYQLTLKVGANDNDASGAFKGTVGGTYIADIYYVNGSMAGSTALMTLH